jgi:hypothetical protein
VFVGFGLGKLFIPFGSLGASIADFIRMRFQWVTVQQRISPGDYFTWEPEFAAAVYG